MSYRVTYLHSHSMLERELRFPKHIVLVDEEFKDLFCENELVPFKYNNIVYYKAPIMSFVNHGGVFKNLMK